MNTVVWKTELGPGQRLYNMPKGAELLSVAIQRGVPTLWFRCDPDAPKESRNLLLIGTGQAFPGNWRFVGTMLTEDQNFVFHVFDGR